MSQCECPEHKVPLTYAKTQFGRRGDCPVSECTVVHWGDSPTSTPGDKATRQARRDCHIAFDSLWKGQYASMERAEAYAWLAQYLNCESSAAHIGMLSQEDAIVVRNAVWNECPEQWLKGGE